MEPDLRGEDTLPDAPEGGAAPTEVGHVYLIEERRCRINSAGEVMDSVSVAVDRGYYTSGNAVIDAVRNLNAAATEQYEQYRYSQIMAGRPALAADRWFAAHQIISYRALRVPPAQRGQEATAKSLRLVLEWEVTTNPDDGYSDADRLADHRNWSEGASVETVYTVRLFAWTADGRIIGGNELDSDGFRASEDVDVESPAPYQAAIARLLERNGLTAADIADIHHPW